MSEYVDPPLSLHTAHADAGAAPTFASEQDVLNHFNGMPPYFPAHSKTQFRAILKEVGKVPLDARVFYALLETDAMQMVKRSSPSLCAEAIQTFAGQIKDDAARLTAATFVSSGSFIQSLHRAGTSEPHHFLIALASQLPDDKSKQLARVEPSKEGNGVFFVFPKEPVNLNPFMMIIGKQGTVDYIVPSYALKSQLSPAAYTEFCATYSSIYNRPMPPFLPPSLHAAQPPRI